MLASKAHSGVLVARRDGVDPTVLRELALAIRALDVSTVALIGAPDAGRVAIVVAARPDGGIDAREIASGAARLSVAAAVDRRSSPRLAVAT